MPFGAHSRTSPFSRTRRIVILSPPPSRRPWTGQPSDNCRLCHSAASSGTPARGRRQPRGRCGREDSNLQGPRGPAGPKPAASTSSATPARDGSRIEPPGKEPSMTTQYDRERESRDSEETKVDEAVERESEERERLRGRLARRKPQPGPGEAARAA